jgi:hypothetical protein
MKSSIDKLTTRFELAEEAISNLKERSIEIIQAEEQEKKMKKR